MPGDVIAFYDIADGNQGAIGFDDHMTGTPVCKGTNLPAPSNRSEIGPLTITTGITFSLQAGLSKY